MKKVRRTKTAAVMLSLTLLFAGLPAEAAEEDNWAYESTQAYYNQLAGQNISINVYNWGEYISDGSDGESIDVVGEFEKVTGIDVNYTTFATNEELYSKLKSGGATYDVIIPSDYMVGRMIEEGMLETLDFENIPNAQNIDESFLNLEYDPQNAYSVPYTWGSVGIIYNTTMIEEEVDSWDYLWDERFMGNILMFSNSKDAFGIALKRLGYSQNTTDPDELEEAAESLKEQKPFVQAYVMDEIFDKMGGGEAAIAPYYAGDAITMIAENSDLAFAFPKEGTNRFIDAACIPKGAANKLAAEIFINFLNEPTIAAANCEYIGYSTPNYKAKELLSEEMRNNPIAYPSDEVLENTEVYRNLPTETNKLIDQLWTEIVSTNVDGNEWFVPILLLVMLAASIFINLRRSWKKKRQNF